MRYRLFVRVSGFRGRDFVKLVEEVEALPRAGEKLLLGGWRTDVAGVYHLTGGGSPIVTAQLYGRTDDKEWEPALLKDGFDPDHPQVAVIAKLIGQGR